MNERTRAIVLWVLGLAWFVVCVASFLVGYLYPPGF